MNKEFTVEDRLKERIKELSCLYSISRVLRKHQDDVEATLKEICEITKNAWRHPEAAIVQLKYTNFDIKTGAIPSKYIFQESRLSDRQENLRYIRVYYDSVFFDNTEFLEEEQQLLDQISIEISDFFERERIKEREELLRRKAEHNDRLAILGEITAGIAHELNTPLGNILGFAELIQANNKDDQTKNDLDKIIKASIYSREIVKKLMFFACEMPHQKQAQQIKPIIEQALSLLGPNLKKAGISCQFKIDEENLIIPIDIVQFTQIIFNLVINAIYVSPTHSYIEILVSHTKDTMLMEVKDQGPGIAKTFRKKVFHPFYSTKPLGEGSGLGLSVVHGIVKAHQGEIKIVDNIPNGSNFKISLPLHP
ncbi:sensor histidine kinase [Zunongwangia sp. HGR-M22]|uniref:sensor histidine kinase n=1 Tax=Zunongwangia sp. HGR-M22 TaxID=3015168 RepID=UPI0022DE6BE6|nr:HAMP domain-containing sensor histidine kinase [Zunongwangia sp. HGR-M22]WBL24783.1 HAMP domain-containing sensor histidine kinase [Zunongwangia sp. HGR-M22]